LIELSDRDFDHSVVLGVRFAAIAPEATSLREMKKRTPQLVREESDIQGPGAQKVWKSWSMLRINLA
jgi:hypothetical protein